MSTLVLPPPQSVRTNETFMAKKEIKAEAAEEVEAVEEAPALEEVVIEAAPKETSDRERRWLKHLAAYKDRNPVKYAIKEKNGEFKEIPASFR